MAGRPPGDSIERRHIGVNVLRADPWALAQAAALTPPEDRTSEQREAAALAIALTGELLAADATLLAVPLSNLGVPQDIKTWIDLIMTDPRAGADRPPLPAAQPIVLATVRGGAHGPGSPRASSPSSESTPHSTPLLNSPPNYTLAASRATGIAASAMLAIRRTAASGHHAADAAPNPAMSSTP
jgi:Flavodoxin-like fold